MAERTFRNNLFLFVRLIQAQAVCASCFEMGCFRDFTGQSSKAGVARTFVTNYVALMGKIKQKQLEHIYDIATQERVNTKYYVSNTFFTEAPHFQHSRLVAARAGTRRLVRLLAPILVVQLGEFLVLQPVAPLAVRAVLRQSLQAAALAEVLLPAVLPAVLQAVALAVALAVLQAVLQVRLQAVPQAVIQALLRAVGLAVLQVVAQAVLRAVAVLLVLAVHRAPALPPALVRVEFPALPQAVTQKTPHCLPVPHLPAQLPLQVASPAPLQVAPQMQGQVRAQQVLLLQLGIQARRQGQAALLRLRFHPETPEALCLSLALVRAYPFRCIPCLAARRTMLNRLPRTVRSDTFQSRGREPRKAPRRLH